MGSEIPEWATTEAQAFHDRWETGMSGAAFQEFARALSQAYERGRVDADKHLCRHAEVQTYTGAVTLVAPPHMKEQHPRGICVDVCLALEITNLWGQGITTTGCCCGHGSHQAYIGVVDADIPRMKELGYEVALNHKRPSDEDSFAPKTPLGNQPGWQSAAQTELAAAIAEFKSSLPGWWYSVCECQVSCDASCAPTVESEHIKLIREAGDPFDSGFHADLRQPSSLAEALRNVMAQALAEIAIRSLPIKQDSEVGGE